MEENENHENKKQILSKAVPTADDDPNDASKYFEEFPSLDIRSTKDGLAEGETADITSGPYESEKLNPLVASLNRLDVKNDRSKVPSTRVPSHFQQHLSKPEAKPRKFMREYRYTPRGHRNVWPNRFNAPHPGKLQPFNQANQRNVPIPRTRSNSESNYTTSQSAQYKRRYGSNYNPTPMVGPRSPLRGHHHFAPGGGIVRHSPYSQQIVSSQVQDEAMNNPRQIDNSQLADAMQPTEMSRSLPIGSTRGRQVSPGTCNLYIPNSRNAQHSGTYRNNVGSGFYVDPSQVRRTRQFQLFPQQQQASPRAPNFVLPMMTAPSPVAAQNKKGVMYNFVKHTPNCSALYTTVFQTYPTSVYVNNPISSKHEPNIASGGGEILSPTSISGSEMTRSPGNSDGKKVRILTNPHRSKNDLPESALLSRSLPLSHSLDDVIAQSRDQQMSADYDVSPRDPDMFNFDEFGEIADPEDSPSFTIEGGEEESAEVVFSRSLDGSSLGTDMFRSARLDSGFDEALTGGVVGVGDRLGYDMEKLKLSRLPLYMSADNLHTIQEVPLQDSDSGFADMNLQVSFDFLDTQQVKTTPRRILKRSARNRSKSESDKLDVFLDELPEDLDNDSEELKQDVEDETKGDDDDVSDIKGESNGGTSSEGDNGSNSNHSDMLHSKRTHFKPISASPDKSSGSPEKNSNDSPDKLIDCSVIPSELSSKLESNSLVTESTEDLPDDYKPYFNTDDDEVERRKVTFVPKFKILTDHDVGLQTNGGRTDEEPSAPVEDDNVDKPAVAGDDLSDDILGENDSNLEMPQEKESISPELLRIKEAGLLRITSDPKVKFLLASPASSDDTENSTDVANGKSNERHASPFVSDAEATVCAVGNIFDRLIHGRHEQDDEQPDKSELLGPRSEITVAEPDYSDYNLPRTDLPSSDAFYCAAASTTGGAAAPFDMSLSAEFYIGQAPPPGTSGTIWTDPLSERGPEMSKSIVGPPSDFMEAVSRRQAIVNRNIRGNNIGQQRFQPSTVNRGAKAGLHKPYSASRPINRPPPLSSSRPGPTGRRDYMAADPRRQNVFDGRPVETLDEFGVPLTAPGREVEYSERRNSAGRAVTWKDGGGGGLVEGGLASEGDDIFNDLTSVIQLEPVSPAQLSSNNDEDSNGMDNFFSPIIPGLDTSVWQRSPRSARDQPPASSSSSATVGGAPEPPESPYSTSLPKECQDAWYSVQQPSVQRQQEQQQRRRTRASTLPSPPEHSIASSAPVQSIDVRQLMLEARIEADQAAAAQQAQQLKDEQAAEDDAIEVFSFSSPGGRGPLPFHPPFASAAAGPQNLLLDTESGAGPRISRSHSDFTPPSSLEMQSVAAAGARRRGGGGIGGALGRTGFIAARGLPIVLKPCNFYLDHGYCRKEDCKYVHDLSEIQCRFWRAGNCFRGFTCPFAHSEMASATGGSITADQTNFMGASGVGDAAAAAEPQEGSATSVTSSSTASTGRLDGRDDNTSTSHMSMSNHPRRGSATNVEMKSPVQRPVATREGSVPFSTTANNQHTSTDTVENRRLLYRHQRGGNNTASRSRLSNTMGANQNFYSRSFDERTLLPSSYAAATPSSDQQNPLVGNNMQYIVSTTTSTGANSRTFQQPAANIRNSPSNTANVSNFRGVSFTRGRGYGSRK